MVKTRVLLAAGSYELSMALRETIEKDAQFQIVAVTSNAYEARDKIIECAPDVMILSGEMPRMSGLDFLKKLIPQYPMPVVFLGEPEQEKEAMEAGAKKFIALRQVDQHTAEYLAHLGLREMTKEIAEKRSESVECNELSTLDKKNNLVIAIGASTGGTEAISKVLKKMKNDLPGIVMVQHMPVGFTQMYAQRLNNECQMIVKEAQSGDVVRPGTVLLAPGDKQMQLVKVNGIYQVECRAGAKVSGHCPSVDVLFSSVAKNVGKNAIGVIMTGMGADGAKGLKEMHDKGALTIGQDENSCVVYGMPRVAYEIGAVDYQVPLEQIAQKIYSLTDKKVKGKE